MMEKHQRLVVGAAPTEKQPRRPVPWWFARRVAKRVKQSTVGVTCAAKAVPAHKNVSPASTKATRLDQATMPKKDSSSQTTTKTAERLPRYRAIQTEVKRVVKSFGVALRHLIADIRRTILPAKKGSKNFVHLERERTKTGKSKYNNPINFVASSRKTEGPTGPKSQKGLSNPLSAQSFVRGSTVGTVSGSSEEAPNSGSNASFGFNYKEHEAREQARIEWRKLTHKLSGLIIRVNGPYGQTSSYDKSTATKLLGLYIKDFGISAFQSYVGELELVIGSDFTAVIEQLKSSLPLYKHFITAGSANPSLLVEY